MYYINQNRIREWKSSIQAKVKKKHLDKLNVLFVKEGGKVIKYNLKLYRVFYRLLTLDLKELEP